MKKLFWTGNVIFFLAFAGLAIYTWMQDTSASGVVQTSGMKTINLIILAAAYLCGAGFQAVIYYIIFKRNQAQ